MKKTLFTFILLLTLLHQEAISQSISINSANNYLCTGNTFKITFSSSGVDADKLSLEIGVKGAQSFMKLNTQRNGDTLSAVVPQNIQEFNHIGLNSRYLIRISSSSPLVKSDTREVDMLDKINFKLSGQIAIGPYENTILTPIVSGKLPYIVKFSNGMEARVDNNTPITVSPVKETVYTPVSVINTCGSGEVSGSQTVIVQPIGLRISSTNLPLGYCAGGFFYVNIIKSAPFNKDNHFTVQQKDNNNNYNDWETTMVNDTLLKVRVPDNMPNQGVNYLRVVGTSPSIISRDFPVQTVIIKRSVKLIPTRITEKNRPYFSMQGSTVGGSSVTLSNGITYSSLDWVYEYDYLMPSNETQTYTITKAEDACGAIPLDENTGSFTVKKIPDVSIFITTGSVSICEGVRTPINIPVFFGQNVEENGDFKLEFSSGDSWNDDPEEVVTARLSSDKKTLIADFPNEFYKRFENPSAPRFFYGKIYNEKLNIISGAFSFNINRLPKASFCCNSSVTIPSRKLVELTPELSGGGPYTIELNDGNVNTINQYNTIYNTLNVYPTKTTEYTIKSVTNVCGTQTSSSGTFTVQVSNPTDFNIEMSKPVADKICVGNSMPFSFEIIGSAPAETKYRVELVDHYSSYSTPVVLGTGTSSPITVNFPADMGFYGREGDVNFDGKSIRITTEDGKVVSNAHRFFIRSTPTASIYVPQSAPVATFGGSISVQLSGGEPFYYSINNGPEKFFVSNTYLLANYFRYKESDSYSNNLQEPGEYRITSVRNECGTGKITGDKLDVMPFAISLDKNSPIFNSCLGGTYPISYSVKGINKAGTLKAVLFNGDAVLKELEVVQQGNPLWVKYPSDLREGRYSLGLIEQNYGVGSNRLEIALFPTPTGKITTRDGGNLGLIDPTYDSYSCIRLTANTNCEAWVENAPTVWSYLYSDNCVTVKPTQSSTIYTLKKLINMCGYIDTESSVRVDFKPYIKILSKNKNYCSVSDVSFQFDAKGVYSDANEFVISLKSVNKSWELRRQKELNFNGALKLPVDLQIGQYDYYAIEVRSTDFSNITQTFDIKLASKPSAEIIDGSTIINPGDRTIIPTKLSGINGNATLAFTNGDTYVVSDNYGPILVNYTNTTVLELMSITNACGTEPGKGKFTVYVNPASTKTINTTLLTQNVCKGGKVWIIPVIQGINAPIKLQVQLSDEKGGNFKDIPTEKIPGTEQLYGTIPENVVEGVNYRLRVVVPDDNEVQSSATLSSILIKDNFVLTITPSKPYYSDNAPAQIKFELTGNSPWNIVYGDTLGNYRTTIRADVSPYNLYLRSSNGNAYFKVFSVRNPDCDAGIIRGTNPFRIELLTPVENEITPVLLYPNPTEAGLQIKSEIAIEKVLIRDTSGKLVKSILKNPTDGVIDVSDVQSSVLIVEVFVKGRVYTYKVVKL